MNKRIKSTAILATVAMSATSVSVLAEEVKTTENIDNINVTTVTTTTKVEVSEAELNEAQGAVVQAETALKDANESVLDIKGQIETLEVETIPNLEESKQTAETTYNNEVKTLNTLNEAHSEKLNSEATQKEIDNLTNLKTSVEELDKVNKELDTVKVPYNVDVEFNLSQEYLSALKDRVAFYMNREPWQGVRNSDNQANDVNNELLVSLSEKLKAENLSNETNTEVWSDSTMIENINELTNEQKKEINFYAINIINKIRNQVVAEIQTDTLPIVQNRKITTADLTKFGQVIDGKILRVTVGNETRDLEIVGVDGDKTLINEIVEVPLQATQASSLLIKKINEVYGIALDTNVKVAGLTEVKLTQGMLNFANEVASKIEKNPTQDVFLNQMVSYPSNIINEAAANNGLRTATSGQHQDELKYFEDAITSPSMTMGQLKTYIYQAFVRYMFEPDFNDSKKDRIWEKAGAVAGLVGKRRDQDLASISLVLAKDPWKAAEYKLTVHTFFEADNSYGITDSAKFDSNVITNGTPEDKEKYDRLIESKTTLEDEISTLTKDLKLNEPVTVLEIDTKISELNDRKKAADALVENKLASIEISTLTLSELNSKIVNQQKVVEKSLEELDRKKSTLETTKNTLETLKNVNLPKAAKIEGEANSTLNEAKTKLKELESGVRIDSESSGIPDNAPTQPSLPEAKIELEEVNFETVYENDPTLELGKEIVVQEGQKGSVQVITIGDQVTEIVMTEKVDKLIKRGTLVK
ncbi:TPA: G5 domain-containing protein, partial [Streptococcus suis]|nr:G5 domain-containing protein [Streptococcus suis]